MNRTVPSFFGMINVGAPHCDRLTLLSTPREHRRSSSDLKVNSCMRGTGNGLVWNGSAFSFSLMSYGWPVKVRAFRRISLHFFKVL